MKLSFDAGLTQKTEKLSFLRRQEPSGLKIAKTLDSRLRGNDGASILCRTYKILGGLRSMIFALVCLAGLTQTVHAEPAPTAKLDQTIAAKVNGVAIRHSDIDAAMPAQLTPAQRQDSGVRQQVLQQLIAQELFWQEARAAGLDKKEEIRLAARAAERATATRLYVRQTLKPALPTEAEIRQRYDAIVANLGPHEYRISLIETADEVAIKTAQAELQKGQSFAQTARQHSRHASAAKGGEIDWLSFPLPVTPGRTNGLPQLYAQIISQLKPGETSAILSNEGRWTLIHLDAMRPTLVPDYAAVQPMLQQMLYQKNVERASIQLTGELLKKAKIEVAGTKQ